jgi:hypothetical protein
LVVQISHTKLPQCGSISALSPGSPDEGLGLVDAITARLCSSKSNPTAVTVALRLPQAPLRQQFALAPHLAGLDLHFDQSGLGDPAAELLPATPPHVGVCLIGGDRPLTRSAGGDRLVIGKSWLGLAARHRYA